MQRLPFVDRIGATGHRWEDLAPLKSSFVPASIGWQSGIDNPAAASAASAYPMGRAYE